MTQFFKLAAAALALSMTTACATGGGGESTVTKSTTLQADMVCQKIGNKTVLVTGTAYNPVGFSGPVHSTTGTFMADAGCNLMLDQNNRPIPLVVAAANASDIRRDITTGFIGVGQSFTNGALAAEIMSNSGCNGGNCGGAPVVVNALSHSASQSGADVGIDIDHSSGPMCGNGGCMPGVGD